MKTVPNQKVVTIASRVKRDKDHLYLMANIDALSEAIKKLNGSGLKMWLYLNKNQDNYKFALSQKDAQDFGIKKDSYYKGIEELIAKGYLCQSCEGSNHFYFCESPRTEPFYFSENQTKTFVSQMASSVSQTKSSAFQERNNTNNTKIIKNITYENTISSSCSPSTTSTNGGSGDCGFATIQVSNNKVDELVGRLNKGKTYESSDVLIYRYF